MYLSKRTPIKKQFEPQAEEKNWQGLQYMFLSVSAFTIMNACAKYLENVTAYQITFFRALGSLVLCLLFLRIRQIPIWGNNKKLLLSRGIVGTISMVLFFLTIKEIPFGSAVCLRYLSPIFAAILAIFWLKERITPLQWSCFVGAFIGVLILRGFDSRITLLGLTYIIISAFFSGMVYVIIRYIGKREHPVVIVTYFMFCATLVGGILSIFNWNTPSNSDWLVLTSLGIFGFFGQFFMTKAYQTTDIGIVGPVKYMESVFALSIGWIWFGEGYEWWSLLGIFLIVGSMLVNILFKDK